MKTILKLLTFPLSSFCLLEPAYKYILFFIYISIATNLPGQVKAIQAQHEAPEVEILTYYNHDRYPEFLYHINPTYDHAINIKGNNWGVDVGYKFNISKRIKVKPSIGYYRFSFDKVDNYNEGFNIHGNARLTTLTPAPGVFFALATDKYYYDCLNVGISGEEKIIDKKLISIWGGIKLNNYFTVAQRYRITYDNPDYPIKNPHRAKRTDYFGFRADAYITGLISIGKIKLGPIISMPVYTIWKTDAFFPDENNSNTRDKWLNGWGVGISVSHKIR